jgi:hypothetical protein
MNRELMARGSISPEQLRVGDPLASDYRRSHTSPGQLIGRYEPGLRPPKRYQAAAHTLTSMAARERLENAMAVLAVEELASIVLHVCVVDQPVTSWRPLNGHPVRVGIARLRDSLDALADHYGAWRHSA